MRTATTTHTTSDAAAQSVKRWRRMRRSMASGAFYRYAETFVAQLSTSCAGQLLSTKRTARAGKI
jgi:hypothetical protein